MIAPLWYLPKYRSSRDWLKTIRGGSLFHFRLMVVMLGPPMMWSRSVVAMMDMLSWVGC